MSNRVPFTMEFNQKQSRQIRQKPNQHQRESYHSEGDGYTSQVYKRKEKYAKWKDYTEDDYE